MTNESHSAPDGIDWELTTFEGARREQLRRWAELSLREMMEAQEEMRTLAERLQGYVPGQGTGFGPTE